MISFGCFLLASVVSLTVSLPVLSSERSFFTNSKKAQARCVAAAASGRPALTSPSLPP